MPSMTTSVMAVNLHHRYGPQWALAGVSFQACEGEIIGILGPNGSGKSTLFAILSTTMVPTGGNAIVAGFDVCEQPAQVRRRIGVVFQPLSLDSQLTIVENLRCQGHLFGLPNRILRERIDSVLEQFGLSGRRNDRVATLSGGQQRKVDVAKALLHAPRVLLMDEPSTGLDAGTRIELWKYLQELRRSKTATVLLTTHILEEAEHCDRLVLLHQGRVVAEGTPQQLKARIGADVLVVEVDDPSGVQERVRERYRMESNIIQNRLYIEVKNGHRFISTLVETFPHSIHSVSLHKPTLEDVFIHETGTPIYREAGSPNGAGK